MTPLITVGAGRLLAIATVLCLGGCAVFQQSAEVAGQASERRQRLDAAHEAYARALTDVRQRQAVQEVDRPWLAGRARPLARELSLPAALRANVQTALMFPDSRVDVPTLAERITLATGIPVRIQPEALLPAERFMPRLAGVQQAAQSVRMPTTYELPVGTQALPKLLDLVAARLGVAWRYRDGALEIFRTETRVFNVRALLLKSTSVSSLGRNGVGNAAFEAASGTRVESSVQDVMAAVTSRLEPLLTLAGTVTAHTDGSSLLVVNDTPQALERVGAFLDRENRALTRRVRIIFEELTVAMRDNGEAGVDWDLVYTAARAAAAASAPGALGAPVAGSLSAGISAGRWTGSSAIIRALNEVGVVTRHTSVPMVTLNRRPVTHAVRTTFSWIDQVQTSAISTVGSGGVSGALPSVSVSQKEETVGQFLTLIPDAQDDGQVLLSVAYDSTVAQPLTSITFGEGGSAVQIQQLTVDGTGSVQQVELRPGQPMIVSGFERRHDEANRQRLDKGWPVWLGGGEKASQARETTLVIITAMVEEGF